MRKGVIVCGVLLLGMGALFTARALQKDEHLSGQLPPAQEYSVDPPVPVLPHSDDAEPIAKAQPTHPEEETSASLPRAVRLAVPFTSQAPHRNWDYPYKEFCEEASVLMVVSYLRGTTTLSPEYADAEMKKIQAFEGQRFGSYEDTTAEETAIILREYYNVENVALLYNPTPEDMMRALAQGKVIIMPAAGRQLGNPYFQQPGPLYHMLVIKGYAEDGRFITNDPGTRRGENFLYEKSVLMNAMHDWNGGNVDAGQKVILIVG